MRLARVALVFFLQQVGTVAFVPYNDTRFVYEGRWAFNGSFATADWPCSSVRFKVITTSSSCRLRFLWSGVRVRVNVTVMDESGEIVNSTVLSGSAIAVPWSRPKEATLVFDDIKAGTYIVSLRKVTSAAPYSMGVARDFIKASYLQFGGLTEISAQTSLEALRRRERKIEFIGASDTEGYCVDGVPNMSAVQYIAEGWKYENCDQATPGIVGRHFNAEISVEAIAGIGLTQNADAESRWKIGKYPMPTLWQRRLQTEAKSLWDFSWIPDLVVVSLGGNDYNHQKGHVPHNETFTQAYENFLLQIFEKYSRVQNNQGPIVVNICGQGTAEETKRDPDNNRCRPCPHVQEATAAFQAKHRARKVHYVFIPCDGSVATGQRDMGCNGHKNRTGQEEISMFLIPKLRALTGWDSADMFSTSTFEQYI